MSCDCCSVVRRLAGSGIKAGGGPSGGVSVSVDIPTPGFVDTVGFSGASAPQSESPILDRGLETAWEVCRLMLRPYEVMCSDYLLR